MECVGWGLDMRIVAKGHSEVTESSSHPKTGSIFASLMKYTDSMTGSFRNIILENLKNPPDPVQDRNNQRNSAAVI